MLIVSNKIFQLQNITHNTDIFESKIDYFITASNCDKRGAEIANRFENKKVGNFIVFDYKKFRPLPSHESFEIYEQTKKLTNTHVVLCDDYDLDVFFLNSIGFKEDDVVAIDITNFCIPDLFRIMYLLKEIKMLKQALVFYTEPKHYLYDNGFLWSTYKYMLGEREYTLIEEYYTSSNPDKTLLVCLLGFDKLVSKYVYENANVKDTIVINGFPPYIPKLKDISLYSNYELVSMLSKNNIFRAQANDPFSVYNTLVDIQKEYPNYILNICSLGTKPMALGACIFALDNPGKVKVSYPVPKEYKINTTKENAEMWYYKIDFERK